MTVTPEAKVKKQIVNILKDYGAYYFYPVTGGFGASGVPDIIVCYLGQFIAIEVKAGRNKPTALQERAIKAILYSGGIALVVNETNIQDVVTTLEHVKQKVPTHAAT
jgi:Holliday junction resolvase